MKGLLNKKQLIICGVILLVIFVGVAAFFLCQVEDESTILVYNGASETVAALSDGESFSQRFTSPNNGLVKINVRIAIENGKPENGEVLFTLRDGNGDVVGEQATDVSRLRSNGPVLMAFDEQKESEGETYELTVATDGIASESALSLMGETQGDTVNAFLSAIYTHHYLPTYFLVIMLVIGICLVPAFTVGKNTKEVASNE